MSFWVLTGEKRHRRNEVNEQTIVLLDDAGLFLSPGDALLCYRKKAIKTAVMI